ERARFTYFRIRSVLSISFSCRGSVFKNLVVWADITIIMFIVYILILFKETVFCSWSCIWHNGTNLFVQQTFRIRWGFVSGIYGYCSWFAYFFDDLFE